MFKDLNGKTALITGAGKRSGIGYAIARAQAELGTNIIIADLGKPGGENDQVVTAAQGEMTEIAGDLSRIRRIFLSYRSGNQYYWWPINGTIKETS